MIYDAGDYHAGNGYDDGDTVNVRCDLMRCDCVMMCCERYDDKYVNVTQKSKNILQKKLSNLKFLLPVIFSGFINKVVDIVVMSPFQSRFFFVFIFIFR